MKEKISVDDFFDVALDPHLKIVGFHIVKKVPYFDCFAGSINTLWVSPQYRKTGIATTLKQRAEQWGRTHKLDHLFTWVHADNLNMLSLNKELGFKVVNYKLKKKL